MESVGFLGAYDDDLTNFSWSDDIPSSEMGKNKVRGVKNNNNSVENLIVGIIKCSPCDFLK